MRKFLLYILGLSILNSCDLFKKDHEQFAQAYKKILITKEVYQDDSLKSLEEIKKIYREFGFTEESFMEEYFLLTQKNTKKFQEILDSIREETQRELVEYQEKYRNKKQYEE